MNHTHTHTQVADSENQIDAVRGEALGLRGLLKKRRDAALRKKASECAALQERLDVQIEGESNLKNKRVFVLFCSVFVLFCSHSSSSFLFVIRATSDAVPILKSFTQCGRRAQRGVSKRKKRCTLWS